MFDEMLSINQLLPYVVAGVVSGLVSWGANSVHLKWLRRDVDLLRYTVHSPKNQNNLVTTTHAISARVAVLETLEERRRK